MCVEHCKLELYEQLFIAMQMDISDEIAIIVHVCPICNTRCTVFEAISYLCKYKVSLQRLNRISARANKLKKIKIRFSVNFSRPFVDFTMNIAFSN